jgi:tRNA pseudouridine38-40 synthase
MRVAYDGTAFCGWQVQPNQVTVAGFMAATFHRTFDASIKLMGASRTDAGVHAIGQVVVGDTDLDINLDQLKVAWNAALGGSVVIHDIEALTQWVDPRCDVVEKEYWYHLFYEKPLPFVRNLGWYYSMTKQVDWVKFEKLLKLYEGTHDFRSFSKQDPSDTRSTVRTVNSVELVKIEHYGAYRVIVKGPSFIRYQVRRMVGYALDLARRPKSSARDLQSLLDSPSDRQELVKADACGLYLKSVTYVS